MSWDAKPINVDILNCHISGTIMAEAILDKPESDRPFDHRSLG
jgi:hypothetical protein